MRGLRILNVSVLALSLLTFAACGKSELKSPEEFKDDNSKFEAARKNYNAVVADDTLGLKYTDDEKIAACDRYLAEAEKFVSNYKEGAVLTDGSKVSGIDKIREDIGATRATRARLVQRRESNEKIKALIASFASASGNAILIMGSSQLITVSQNREQELYKAVQAKPTTANAIQDYLDHAKGVLLPQLKALKQTDESAKAISDLQIRILEVQALKK